jgi:hypothetical protein
VLLRQFHKLLLVCFQEPSLASLASVAFRIIIRTRNNPLKAYVPSGAGQRYDRDKLLALVDEVTTHFLMPNSFERSKMRTVCQYLADGLDRCSGSTLQQRWNDFEKRFWPKWKSGVDRRGST